MIKPESEDLKPFTKFKIGDLERWLRTGLEGYLLENKSIWAFDHLAVFIDQDEHLVLDLCNIYRAFPSRKQAYFRQAVANLIANLEPIERNIIIFEHLLSLAGILPAGSEVLRVLPARVGNGFFGLTKNREGKSLFDLTMMTIAELAVPTKDAVDCLHALIGSSYFENAYAGMALTALCRTDDKNLADHMALLREPLAAMFHQYNVDDTAKQRLAKKILDAIGLKLVVQALDNLVCSEPPKEGVVTDNWFLIALRSHDKSLLSLLSWESRDGKMFLYRKDKPEVKIPLPDTLKPKPQTKKPSSTVSMNKIRQPIPGVSTKKKLIDNTCSLWGNIFPKPFKPIDSNKGVHP